MYQNYILNNSLYLHIIPFTHTGVKTGPEMGPGFYHNNKIESASARDTFICDVQLNAARACDAYEALYTGPCKIMSHLLTGTRVPATTSHNSIIFIFILF